jgi:hypothetical protein
LYGEAAAHLFAPRLGVFDYLHGAVHRGAFLIKEDGVNLPQFNGYFKSATMSLKEYPNDNQKKAL